MIDLFKPKKTRSVRVYSIECINKEKGIVCSLSINPKNRNFYTCLCLGSRVVKNNYPSRFQAEEQLKKYKQLYANK
jgi:hypothetical protein